MEYNPLFELNKGVAQALLGERTAAWQSLRHALEWMRDVRNQRSDKTALYTPLLGTRDEKVSFAADLPVDAAVLINLWTLGDQREGELLEELRKLYPEEYANWVPLIDARRKSE